jgi:hypothetical protein
MNAPEMLKDFKLVEILEGWQKIFNDKMNHNELTQVYQVNPPNYDVDLDLQDI